MEQGTLIYRTKIDDKGFKDGLNKNKQSIRTASNQSQQATDKLNRSINKTKTNVSSLQRQLIGAFSGGVVLAGVGKYAPSILKMGSALEDTRVQFTNFLKSKELADEYIDVLNEFANVTPYANEQVLKAGRTLMAFSQELEQTRDSCRRL